MAMTTNKTVTGENIYYAGLVVHVSFTEKISLHAITGDYDIKLSLTDCEVNRSRTAASWLPSSRLYTSDYFIA